MFLIVNINPAIDRIYRLANFRIDQIHRTSQILSQAGGKGINVARACKVLGGEAIVTGFLGGHAGRFIQDNMNNSGLRHDFLPISQEARTCIILIDDLNHTQTVINEDGPCVSAGETAQFLEKFRNLVGGFKLVVISGSVPASVPPDLYVSLVHIAQEKHIPCIVDASKVALKHAIAAKPFCVKANIHELNEIYPKPELVTQSTRQNFTMLLSVCQELLESGCPNVLITLGELGAVYCSLQQTLWAKAPRIQAVNAVGSGDAMAAALAMELGRNLSWEEALVSGVAAGTANATVGGLRFTYEEYANLRKLVVLEKL